MLVIGKTPARLRRIAPVTGGTFPNERLNGTVLSDADWVIIRPDGVMVIDVRLVLSTDDERWLWVGWRGTPISLHGACYGRVNRVINPIP